jgi:hypothetical protein
MSERKPYTDYQLKNFAIQAGFPEELIGDVVRLIKAESSGYSDATNFKYPDKSYGLLQINMLDEPGYLLGEDRRKRYNLPNNEALFDPLTNLKVAKDIYERKGGFGDWGAWTSGAYKDYDYNPQIPLQESAVEAVNLSENWLQRLNPFRKKESAFPGSLPSIPNEITTYGGNYE